MQFNEKLPRRSSTEERRVFRTARLEFVKIGRITGMDAAAAQLLRTADIAPARLLRFDDWSTPGLEALMLSRLPVVVGPASGHGPLGWLANPEIMLAAKQHWSADTLIPAIVLAHQVAERTRHMATGGWMFAASTPALSAAASPAAMHRLWNAMIQTGINPLASELKMNLVRAIECDPRKLPAVRPASAQQPDAAA
jgi:hypothetical protein